jgi:uncharacterized membrane protein
MRLILPLALSGLLAIPARAQEAAEPAAADHAGWLDAHVEFLVQAIEAVGIAIIVLAAIAASAWFLVQLARTRAPAAAYDAYRANLGRGILLGLEFLVAADIIGTVAIDPTLQSLAVLAGIVLIRTFLSFSLEVEIEGHWPWRRSREAGAVRSRPRAEERGLG